MPDTSLSEARDNHGREPRANREALADKVADLVICALHMAKTNPLGPFDLEAAVVDKLEVRNGVTIPPATPAPAQPRTDGGERERFELPNEPGVWKRDGDMGVPAWEIIVQAYHSRPKTRKLRYSGFCDERPVSGLVHESNLPTSLWHKADASRSREVEAKVDELECTLDDEEAAHQETLVMLATATARIATLAPQSPLAGQGELDTDPDQILAAAGSHWVDQETKRVIRENAELRAEVARMTKGLDDAQQIAEIVLSSLRWTGDGYEWTGGQWDYRMTPGDAVALTDGKIKAATARITTLEADLAAANERVALAGGYHERTEREIKIEAFNDMTHFRQEDVRYLLDLVDAGRNRVYTTEAERDAALAQVRELREALERLFYRHPAQPRLTDEEYDMIRPLLSATPAPQPPLVGQGELAIEKVRQAWQRLAGFAVCESNGAESRYRITIDYPTLDKAQDAYRALHDIAAAITPIEPPRYSAGEQGGANG